MRYIFFGTPEFAAIILEKLVAAGFIPEVVVCNPNRPVGRKKILTPPPVKQRIMNYESRIKNEIKIIQPEKLALSLFTIHNSLFDFFIVAAYAKIIPKSILEIPRLGTINVHPSLLPKYRGPSPIQTAILNGDTETGVTLFLLDEKIDQGPIITNSKLQIPNYKITYTELMEQLATLGAQLLIETLPKFTRGEIMPQPQDETKATYTKKFVTANGFVDYHELVDAVKGENPRKADELERKIRALNPEPGVWTVVKEPTILDLPYRRRVKLLSALLEAGKLKLTSIQVEGKQARLL